MVNFPFSITARIILLSVRYPFMHRHFKQRRILYSVDGDFDSHRFMSDVIGYKEKNYKALCICVSSYCHLIVCSVRFNRFNWCLFKGIICFVLRVNGPVLWIRQIIFILDSYISINISYFYDMHLLILSGAVVVVIVWWLDLQLPMQSVPITTNVVTSNPADDEVYSIQHYAITFVSDLWQVHGFLRVLRLPPPIKLTTTI